MNALIITGDNQTRENFVVSFTHDHSIPLYYVTKFGPSVKIADIRTLKKKLSFSIREDEMQLFVLHGEITIDAQNALLKSLEELPRNTCIILSIPTKEQLLPTVLSRCEIKTLARETTASDEKLLSRFIQLNKSMDYSELTILLEQFNNVSSDEDFKNFLMTFKTFINNSIFEESTTIKTQMLEMFISVTQIYPLCIQNNINKRLAVEVSFFS